MKLKGINPFEQHVEKIIIGGCGVAFVGALAWQFFFSESEVTVGKDSVPVSRAFEPAEKEAKNKLAQMDDANPKNMPELPKIDLSGGLRLGSHLALPEAAGNAVAMGRDSGVGSIKVKGGPSVNVQLGLPVVPATAKPFALAFRNTVNPVEKFRSAELSKLLPEQQPFDKAAVSVEAEFDGKALLASLSADPDGAGPLAPIPKNWIEEAGSQQVEIVGVQIERRTVRRADGTAPSAEETVPIGVIPGRTDPVSYWKEHAHSASDVPSLLEDVRDAIEDIQRPPYLDTIAGVEWAPPRDMLLELQPEGASRKDVRTAVIKRELKKLDRRIASLGGAKGPAMRDGPRPPAGPGAGGGRPGGPGSGPGRGMAPQTQPGREGGGDKPNSQDDQAEKTRQKNLERLRKKREDLVKELQALGDKSQPVEGDAGLPVAAVPVFQNEKVKLWAHDLTVEPGAVYQYRMRVVVNNPLFERSLQNEQAALAKQQLIEGGWSDWSDAVDVGRDRYFFITNAVSHDGVSGRPRATAELFVFYYGYYRSGSASVEPGDVMNAKATLPDLLLADMATLETAFRNSPGGEVPPLDPIKRKAGEEGTTPPPPGAPPRPGPSGPGRLNDPRAAAALTPDQIMTVGAPQEIPLPVDAILMDVVAALGQTGGGQERFDVTFRDQTGALVTISPDRDRSRPEYKVVDASAKAGRDQGKTPPPEVEEPDNFIPVKRERPTNPGAGGGGGGG